jgi:hypothetical protein
MSGSIERARIEANVLRIAREVETTGRIQRIFGN